MNVSFPYKIECLELMLLITKSSEYEYMFRYNIAYINTQHSIQA